MMRVLCSSTSPSMTTSWWAVKRSCVSSQPLATAAALLTAHRHASSSAASPSDVTEWVKPLVQRISAAPHRDISHVHYSELLRLYAAGRQDAASASTAGASPAGASSAVDQFEAVFNEWCLRSVFSSKWKDVDVDAHGLLHHLHQLDTMNNTATSTQARPAADRKSGAKNVKEGEDSVALATSLIHMCRWTKGTAALPQQPSTVLTTSCFVSALPSYHNLAHESSEPAASSVPLVRSSGGKRIEAVMTKIRRQRHQLNVAPAESTQGEAPPRLQAAVWVPFSTLYDVRRVAFGKSRTTAMGGPAVGPNAPPPTCRPPSPQDTLSLAGALQLVRQALALQDQVNALQGGAARVEDATANRLLLRVVPPTVEFSHIMSLLRLRIKPSTQAPLFTAEQLCESSLLRWTALGRFYQGCSLAVEGAAERRVAIEFGDVVHRSMPPSCLHNTGPVLLQAHANESETSPRSSHQFVVAQCGDLSQQLARREQRAKAVPRY